MEKEFDWGWEGGDDGRGGRYTNGERIRKMCLREASSDFPTCHPLSHSQSPENSLNIWVIQSNGKNTNSVVHGDCNALGLNLNVWYVQVREMCEFWWGNKKRRLRLWCKRGFGTTCEESMKYIKVDILFSTKSTEIPNQKKRKENGPLWFTNFRITIKGNTYFVWIHIICPSTQKTSIKACGTLHRLIKDGSALQHYLLYLLQTARISAS